MISIENPPSDLASSCKISPSKSIRNSHQRDYYDQQLLEVDLYSSELRFSIRDYVFNTRSNDIKTNWPFSQKNLELCLKHGVTNMLPPFQSLDSVRNPSVEKCAVESMSLDEENTCSHHANLPGSSNHCISAAFNNVGCCNQRLEVDCENINSSDSIEDKNYPSTTMDQSCFEIDPVPTLKIPCLEPKANSLPGSSVGKPDSSVPISNKVRNTVQKPDMKCRLIVKSSNIADPKSKEDPAANASKVLETMASQVCPVCKIFSSSSNTTLNAHIDQCLSEESTNKWTDNSKTIKHRIKTRKIRLVEDIYATSQHCTLEELDRRNGTN